MRPQSLLDNLESRCSALTSNVSAALAGPAGAAAASLNSWVGSAVHSLSNQGREALLAGISRFAAPAPSAPSPSSLSLGRRSPVWARIPRSGDGGWGGAPEGQHRFDLAMSTEVMEERLAGIPVYALSNSAEEFVLVSGVKSGKSLGIFCLKEEDAETLLEQMKSMNPGMRQGSKVVAVALNKARGTAFVGI